MKKIITALFVCMLSFAPIHSFAAEGTVGTCEMTISKENVGFENGVQATNYCKGHIVGFYEAGMFHLEGAYSGQVKYSGQQFEMSNPFSPNVKEILTVYTDEGNDEGARNYTRISGTTRLDTAIEVSKKGWPNGLIHAEKSVILARADQPFDALAASSLAGVKDAPILLTYTSDINKSVINELVRLNTEKIYILGGAAAVSLEVENKLKELDFNVYRIAGSSRFETAAKINNIVTSVNQTNTKAIIANGYTVADALSASAYAANSGVPIYLATKDKLPVELPDRISSVDIYGGTAVISDELLSQLKTKGIAVKRIAGASRYSTSVEAAKQLNESDIILVRGSSTTKTKEDYPDAVVASSLAKRLGTKILLSHPSKVQPEVKSYLQNKSFNAYVLGGENAISDKVVTELNLK